MSQLNQIIKTAPTDLDTREDYWDSFYARRASNKQAPLLPSQFAAFAASELGAADTVIEFGCGNGRDSEFFAAQNLNVLALDGSAEAIRLCTERSDSGVRYVQKAVGDAKQIIEAFLQNRPLSGNIAVYARFFLHAITSDEQTEFFDLLMDVVPTGGLVLLEYRVTEDEAVEKEFGIHFRRFLKQDLVLKSLMSRGFEVEYEIQGRGFAKYLQEDAMVGRCIVRKL